MRTFLFALTFATALATGLISTANVCQASDARDFRALLRSTVSEKLRAPESFSQIHLLPDSALQSAAQAESAKAALEYSKQTSLTQLLAPSMAEGSARTQDAEAALARQPLTLVIVPGVFGELIPTRAFEEVLAQPSKDRELFEARVHAEREKRNPLAEDETPDSAQIAMKKVPLSDLVHVGTLKGRNGENLARVVLFATPFGSLESMGDLADRAALFNRRLNKYLALTGDQRPMAIIGYSRGTTLGLEMLAQAKEQNLPWLAQVKGMVSLGGVVWGSSIADSAFVSGSAKASAITALKKLRSELDPDSKWNTLSAWAKFAATTLRLLPELSKVEKQPSSKDLKASPVGAGLDMTSALGLVNGLAGKLGITSPISGFSGNVRRFQLAVDAIITAVEQLTSLDRERWWKTRTLPLHVTYYSLSAAMANPEASEVERQHFAAPIGYSSRSYDDLYLLQGRLDYEGITGVSLNDSQVAVAQSMFLPEASARLNPANRGMRVANLGIMGTHHWGLALKVVNAMKDGRTNPFPREAVLKALAAKISLDLKNPAQGE